MEDLKYKQSSIESHELQVPSHKGTPLSIENHLWQPNGESKLKSLHFRNQTTIGAIEY